MSHVITLRVYYEDTDLAGVVYYANYLKYIERARSDWLRQLGINQTVLRDQGVVFAVRALSAEYLAPARFDDELTVTATPDQISGARLVLDQRVLRGDTLLFSAKVTLVAMSAEGRPTRLPDALLTALGN